MNTNIQVDLQSEDKQVVLEEMEKMGLLSKMKAQIKSNVLKILEKQKQSVKQNVEFDYMTPLNKMNKSKEILLACHLVKEFLSFYEMEYTSPVFENESNVRESVKRETLTAELSLQNVVSSTPEPKPLLVQLIAAYQSDLLHKKNSTDNLAKGLDDSYGVKGHHYPSTDANFSNLVKNDNQSSGLGSKLPTGKKQLSPITFMNKSVEIGESSSPDKVESLKFNTANITDIYSQGQGQGQGKALPNLSNLTNLKTPVNIAKLNSEENKNKIQHNQNDNQFQFHTAEYNSNNKYDDEFNEVILEEISDKKGPEEEIDMIDIEDSKKSITASANNFMSSFGYDSSITNYKLDEFDHVEDVEKP